MYTHPGKPRRAWPPAVIPALAALAAAAIAAGPVATDAAAAEVAAKVDGKAIDIAQVNAKAVEMSGRTAQERYDLQQRAMNELIAEMLFEKEAKKRGTTVEKLLAAEVTAKVKPVSDDESKAWYDANPRRVGGRPFEQINGQIKQLLAGERQGQARSAFIDSLKKTASVELLMEPPRAEIKIAKNDPAKGPATAAVTIVEFSDFQ